MSWKERLERDFTNKFGLNLDHVKTGEMVIWAAQQGLLYAKDMALTFDFNNETDTGAQISAELDEARKELA